jgi:dihydroorotate dehydrogenase (fumarate)
MTTLSMTLAGIHFPSCLMNASGAWSGTHSELRDLAASATGAVVIKTTTTEARVEEVKGCNIENPGQPYYLALLPELQAAAKPIIGSVAGFDIAEYIALAQAYAEAGVPVVELNLSDPMVPCNRAGNCDLAAVEAVLQAVRGAVQVPLAVKLPVLPDGDVSRAVGVTIWRSWCATPPRCLPLHRPLRQGWISLPWAACRPGRTPMRPSAAVPRRCRSAVPS